MEEKLSNAERILLEWIAKEAKKSFQKRARLILLDDQDLLTKAISLQVGLSRGRVRYWKRSFREKRMEIFPPELFEEAIKATQAGAESSPEHISPEPMGEDVSFQPEAMKQADPQPEISIGELCERYRVDKSHAQYVGETVLTLFDRTADIHGLPEEWRELLEKAADLHHIGFATYPDKYDTVGRDILIDHRLSDVSEIDQRVIACAIALNRRKFKLSRLRKELLINELPEEIRDKTLTLSALLKIAAALDSSLDQTSFIDELQVLEDRIDVSIKGPSARQNASRASAKSDLWNHLFKIPFRFNVEGVSFPKPAAVEQVPAVISPPRKLKSPGLLPNDRMSEAGRKVLRYHFERMLTHEQGTRIGEDIEELHDMRVATRRMRAAFRVFKPYYDPDVLRPHIKGLRRTGRALGSVRDLDVFMVKALRYLEMLPEQERTDLEPLLEIWREQRQAAREEMLDYLDGKRYQRFVQRFQAFLMTEGEGALPIPRGKPVSDQVYQIVPTLIYTRFQVVRGYQTIVEDAPIEMLHSLRIDCKRFRYAVEFFREVLGPEAEDVIEEVVLVQDHLGDLHDADVACQLLIGFLDQWSGRERRDQIRIGGVTRYLVTKQGDLRSLVNSFPDVWQNFIRPELRKKLALAISIL
jgi:CHAD domain-containing protein